MLDTDPKGWDEEDCAYVLRSLEHCALTSVLAALRAQGPPTEYTFILLDHIKAALFITDDRFRSEVRRFANDERLIRVATVLNPSYETYSEWCALGKEPFHPTEDLPPAPKPFGKSSSSKVCQQLLDLAQEHNNKLNEKNGRLCELLQLPEMPYVPERLRAILRDTQHCVKERVLPVDELYEEQLSEHVHDTAAVRPRRKRRARVVEDAEPAKKDSEAAEDTRRVPRKYTKRRVSEPDSVSLVTPSAIAASSAAEPSQPPTAVPPLFGAASPQSAAVSLSTTSTLSSSATIPSSSLDDNPSTSNASTDIDVSSVVPALVASIFNSAASAMPIVISPPPNIAPSTARLTPTGAAGLLTTTGRSPSRIMPNILQAKRTQSAQPGDAPITPQEQREFIEKIQERVMQEAQSNQVENEQPTPPKRRRRSKQQQQEALLAADSCARARGYNQAEAQAKKAAALAQNKKTPTAAEKRAAKRAPAYASPTRATVIANHHTVVCATSPHDVSSTTTTALTSPFGMPPPPAAAVPSVPPSGVAAVNAFSALLAVAPPSSTAVPLASPTITLAQIAAAAPPHVQQQALKTPTRLLSETTVFRREHVFAGNGEEPSSSTSTPSAAPSGANAPRPPASAAPTTVPTGTPSAPTVVKRIFGNSNIARPVGKYYVNGSTNLNAAAYGNPTRPFYGNPSAAAAMQQQQAQTNIYHRMNAATTTISATTSSTNSSSTNGNGNGSILGNSGERPEDYGHDYSTPSSAASRSTNDKIPVKSTTPTSYVPKARPALLTPAMRASNGLPTRMYERKEGERRQHQPRGETASDEAVAATVNTIFQVASQLERANGTRPSVVGREHPFEKKENSMNKAERSSSAASSFHSPCSSTGTPRASFASRTGEIPVVAGHSTGLDPSPSPTPSSTHPREARDRRESMTSPTGSTSSGLSRATTPPMIGGTPNGLPPGVSRSSALRMAGSAAELASSKEQHMLHFLRTEAANKQRAESGEDKFEVIGSGSVHDRPEMAIHIDADNRVTLTARMPGSAHHSPLAIVPPELLSPATLAAAAAAASMTSSSSSPAGVSGGTPKVPPLTIRPSMKGRGSSSGSTSKPGSALASPAPTGSGSSAAHSPAINIPPPPPPSANGARQFLLTPASFSNDPNAVPFKLVSSDGTLISYPPHSLEQQLAGGVLSFAASTSSSTVSPRPPPVQSSSSATARPPLLPPPPPPPTSLPPSTISMPLPPPPPLQMPSPSSVSFDIQSSSSPGGVKVTTPRDRPRMQSPGPAMPPASPTPPRVNGFGSHSVSAILEHSPSSSSFAPPVPPPPPPPRLPPGVHEAPSPRHAADDDYARVFYGPTVPPASMAAADKERLVLSNPNQAGQHPHSVPAVVTTTSQNFERAHPTPQAKIPLTQKPLARPFIDDDDDDATDDEPEPMTQHNDAQRAARNASPERRGPDILEQSCMEIT